MTALLDSEGSADRRAVDVAVCYQPILDVARGVAAGYQAHSITAATQLLDQLQADSWSTAAGRQDGPTPDDVAATISAALAALPTLPADTFLAVPVPAASSADPVVRAALLDVPAPGTLERVVLDVAGFSGHHAEALEPALAEYRAAGAMISVGGSGTAQPELASIVRLKPAIIRLGRDWVRGIDTSEGKRSTIAMIGRLAGRLDAWILCEGVATAAELRTLASLQVPLAHGPFIGEPQRFWPDIDLGASTALRNDQGAAGSDGTLRELMQQAYTTTDATAAAVLPESSGLDLVVVVDGQHRPVSLLDCATDARWQAVDVLPVNVDTPVPDVVSRAMARPRATRFTPVACTDARGRLLGVVRIEQLISHLARS